MNELAATDGAAPGAAEYVSCGVKVPEALIRTTPLTFTTRYVAVATAAVIAVFDAVATKALLPDDNVAAEVAFCAAST
jgi:hypothetical protein